MLERRSVTSETALQTDYDQIEAAVMETARGRWFLAEHARRHRIEESEALFAALEKLARIIERQGQPPVPALAVSASATGRLTRVLRPSVVSLQSASMTPAADVSKTAKNEHPPQTDAVDPSPVKELKDAGLVGDERDTFDYGQVSRAA
jgi:hypothetical protein